MKSFHRFFPFFILILTSLFVCGDLLLFSGQPANMDGSVHLTNIATFHKALAEGDFPVGWTDGYANYGLPMGYFAQQTTSYGGAALYFLTGNLLLAFALTYLIGTFLSAFIFYWLMRQWVPPLAALTGAVIFQVAPYRIANIYIRGALPEFFSSVFVLWLLLAMKRYAVTSKTGWWLGIALGTAGLLLTHPMNALTGLFILLPFFGFLWLTTSSKKTFGLRVGGAVFIGFLLTGYYIAPLLLEIKYFYYSQLASHYTANAFVHYRDLLNPSWPYFLPEMNNILSRGHLLKPGIPEMGVLLGGVIIMFFYVVNRHKHTETALFSLLVTIGVVTLCLTLPFSEGIYLQVPFMAQIQFPWRMLSTFIFIPPMILSLFLKRLPQVRSWAFVAGLLILVSRFPQLYGKNNAFYQPTSYEHTRDNPHDILMNPIWTGKATTYPQTVFHGEIVEGEGAIIERLERESRRLYTIDAKSNVRLSDNTFYFPGWEVWVNGKRQEIEFQDPHYRGVITYRLPAGKHVVQVVFKDTKVRRMGKLASLVGLVALAVMIYTIKTKQQKRTTAYPHTH